jgi:hypothetical protein
MVFVAAATYRQGVCVALCREVDLRTDKVYRVEVSYMEIYNEALYDLLADNPAAADNLAILGDASNTVVRKRQHHNCNSRSRAKSAATSAPVPPTQAVGDAILLEQRA